MGELFRRKVFDRRGAVIEDFLKVLFSVTILNNKQDGEIIIRVTVIARIGGL